MELNGRPVASAPIFSSTPWGECCRMARIAVGTFDTDSMPKRYEVSPRLTAVPSGSITLSPKRAGSMLARKGM